MSTSILLLGDLMADITALVPGPLAYASDTPAAITLQPGGAAANTAVWLAHLGERPKLLGCIGEDDLGDLLHARLLAAGVEVAATRVPGRTGVCIAIVDASAERTMLPDAGANAMLQPGHLPASEFAAGRHLHCSGYTLLNPGSRAAGLEALRIARAAGMGTSLDPASAGPLREHGSAIRGALAGIDLLLANEEEASVLAAQADPMRAALVLAESVPTVVLKRGPLGAALVRGDAVLEVPAVPAPAVDTTGAGDAFAAGFLRAWTAGAEPGAALAAGCEVAAVAVGRVGGWPPLR